MTEVRQRVKDILTIFYTTALIVLSLMPSQDVPSVSGQDLLEHFLAYLVLAFLISLSLEGRMRKNTAAAFLFSVNLGILLEILQEISGIRNGSWADALADTAGAGLMCAVIYPAWRSAGPKNKRSRKS